MRSAEQMWDDFLGELSTDLQRMAEQPKFLRWVNDGKSRIGYYVGGSAAITWAIGDLLISLPTDYCEFDSIEPASGTTMPEYRIWRDKIRLTSAATSAGSATLYYQKLPPDITGAADSTLPDILDQGLISFALFKFFKWLATSRADYRRYSTIAQGNAADIPQLLAAAAGHRADFAEASDLRTLQAPVTYFGD
jgi:hypothetical protein